MASILYLTDSAYYPAFKSMFRNVVAAMKEAQAWVTIFFYSIMPHDWNLCEQRQDNWQDKENWKENPQN